MFEAILNCWQTSNQFAQIFQIMFFAGSNMKEIAFFNDGKEAVNSEEPHSRFLLR